MASNLLLPTLLFLTFFAQTLCYFNQDFYKISVIHLNDFHARYEESNDEGGVCKDKKCIGGFSRMYSAVNQLLSKQPDSILLNGGDNFQGTLYYNIFKWNITQYFVNMLPWDAVVLGNHEFDDGIKGVVPFIKHLKAPVVVSNMNDTLEPEIQGTYKKSIIIERNGKKIGIVGVIVKTTNELSKTENLSFFDESESVNAEAERLVREEGVFTNIVLSHSGYDVEQEIGKKATAESKISLVVGAHSHTFLYTGEPVPGPDKPAGPYPTIVKRQSDKQRVLVVQASAYCKYLGNLSVTYDNNGNIVSWSGAPIFLSHDSPQDKKINQKLQPWKDGVDKEGHRIIGQSLVTLDQESCGYQECTLGDFVADAMVYSYAYKKPENAWTYASLAVNNGGGLRTSISSGNITYEDMISAEPFGNTFDVGEIQGKYIREMFEFSVTPYFFESLYIDVNLLQISGFRVVANLSQPIGRRIESVKVRCDNCTIPIYEDLDLDRSYRLVVSSFLRNGGNGFKVVKENLKNVKVGPVDIDVFVDYLQHRSPIFEEMEGRMILKGGENIRIIHFMDMLNKI